MRYSLRPQQPNQKQLSSFLRLLNKATIFQQSSSKPEQFLKRQREQTRELLQKVSGQQRALCSNFLPHGEQRRGAHELLPNGQGVGGGLCQTRDEHMPTDGVGEVSDTHAHCGRLWL